jgi:Cytochrome c554 and c-prime
VSDGKTPRSAPLAWAFGAGRVGQSFLFERDGAIHEARVSYYDSIRTLDFTPNRALAAPRDVEEAMSRRVGDAEVRRCFACHTTASAKPSGDVDFAGLISGVTCEACHGPGRAHVTTMAQGRTAEGRAVILNPRSLDAADSIDFCGACHATFWDVKLANESGIAALRSQPFRIQSSRCWSQADARLTCVSCHDPHQPLVRDTASYDSRCLGCHVSAGTPTDSHPGRACKVQKENCASCHMPKYEVPGMHFQFTDHLIRVVRP